MSKTFTLSLVLPLCFIASVGSVNAQAFQFREDHNSGEQGSKYAWSLAADDRWVVVGIPFSTALAGKVMVYDADAMPNGSAGPVATLSEGLSPLNAQRFGASVAVGGDHLAVGNCSPQSTEAYCNSDADRVSTFHYNASAWTETALIQRPPEAVDGTFGRAIALSTDHLAIGGARASNGSVTRDVVYIYAYDGSSFGTTPVASLDIGAAATSNSVFFGHALAFDGNTLVVGARGDDELGVDAGAAYVFNKDEGGTDQWGLVRKLLAANGAAGDNFGYSVAVRDGLAAIGAPGRTVNDVLAGGAYVFQRDLGFAGNWGEVASLTPAAPQAGMGFGTSVAVGNERIAVGAPLAVHSSAGTDGSVDIFRTDGAGGWTRMQSLVPFADGNVNAVSRSGTSVGFAQGRLLVGAPWASITQPAGVPTGGVLVYAESPVGLEELGTTTARIWPVPAADHVSVHVPEKITGTSLLRLVDAAGRAVRSEPTTAVNGTAPFSLTGIAPGSYVLQVVDGSTGVAVAQGRIVLDR